MPGTDARVDVEDVVDETVHASEKRMTLIAFSGDMDKLMAAMSLATTAAAAGTRVTVFFTFWGITALRARKTFRGKGLLERMMNVMLPGRPNRTGLSRMNMWGAGPRFFREIMRRKHVADVDALVETARLVGVELIACTMSMDVMGISADELTDGVQQSGAAVCVKELLRSDATLFI